MLACVHAREHMCNDHIHTQAKLSDDDLTMILAEASKAGSKGDAVDQVSLLAALDRS